MWTWRRASWGFVQMALTMQVLVDHGSIVLDPKGSIETMSPSMGSQVPESTEVLFYLNNSFSNDFHSS